LADPLAERIAPGELFVEPVLKLRSNSLLSLSSIEGVLKFSYDRPQK